MSRLVTTVCRSLQRRQRVVRGAHRPVNVRSTVYNLTAFVDSAPRREPVGDCFHGSTPVIQDGHSGAIISVNRLLDIGYELWKGVVDTDAAKSRRCPGRKHRTRRIWRQKRWPISSTQIATSPESGFSARSVERNISHLQPYQCKCLSIFVRRLCLRISVCLQSCFRFRTSGELSSTYLNLISSKHLDMDKSSDNTSTGKPNPRNDSDIETVLVTLMMNYVHIWQCPYVFVIYYVICLPSFRTHQRILLGNEFSDNDYLIFWCQVSGLVLFA